ncbi:CHASE4 domain-containing protein [Vibrio sp. SA48]|uniref:CHASE4 domain-containing protein n=1 Tax=Vibrio sp. S12_S33 TaxID=2720223 RepID=UPI001EE15CD7|nr:CHASE4 domain-containing protein [Vibrio sp. S12_S33]
MFKNFSLKWLTAWASVTVIVLFVLCYLLFKYMWSYDRAVEHALSLQQGGVKRVQTVVNIAKAELGSSLADYAAWNDMADFIRNPTEEFVQDDIGSHAFESNSLNGILFLTTMCNWFGD